MTILNQDAYEALIAAQIIAGKYGHANANTEHLLFALLMGEDASVLTALQTLKLTDFPGFYKSINELSHEAGADSPVSVIGIDERSAFALTFATEEAGGGTVE